MRTGKLFRIFTLLITLLLITMATTGQWVGAQEVEYSCFPTCEENDGKMLADVVGSVYETLSLEPTLLFIASDTSELQLGIFDADIAGKWDSVTIKPTLASAVSIYRLYADPLQTGNPQSLTQIASYLSTDAGAVDNGWYMITRAQDPTALGSDGQYHYLLFVDQTVANSAAINAFKIRVVGTVAMRANSAFGLIASITNAVNTIYPEYPALTPTSYDGDWSFTFNIPEGQNEDFNELTLWTGDMDFGDGVTTADTDDPDTPNTVPAFNTSADTKPEGAQGTGMPKENNNNLNGAFARGASVTVELADPNGVRYLDNNPSGNREWEKFTIRRKLHPNNCAVPTSADFCVDVITPGLWTINILGLDLSNVIYLRPEFELSGVGTGNGSIGNTVWLDVNGNGFFDQSGEGGINGVRVRLQGDVDGDGAIDIIRFATTAPAPLGPGQFLDGQYRFGNLPAGAYTVTVLAENFAQGKPLAELTQTIDRSQESGDGYNRSNPWTVQLQPNEDYIRADFGYGSTGAIGNYVWIDENNDGYQDAGEPGLPSVTVELRDDKGTVVATTTTDARGGYLFPNLAPGNYMVQVNSASLPAGLTQTTHPVLAGADFGNQSQPYAIGLGLGEENLTADFGYNWNPDDQVNQNTGPAALGDRVWVDTNGNGIQDGNEIGVAGVTVNLIGPGPDGLFGTPDDAVLATQTTNATGNYIFTNLAPGAYQVEVPAGNFDAGKPLAGFTQTGDPDHFAASGTNNDNKTTTPVILSPGDVFLNADFGYQPAPNSTGSLGNLVWFDANASGTPEPMDAGEYGIPGVTVALIKDSNGNGTWDAGEPIIGTTTTDGSGRYLFAGLPLNTRYLVWVNDTAHVLGGLAPTFDANGIATPNISVTTLTPGTPNDLSQDFSYAPRGHRPGTGLIGDKIFVDSGTSGVQDGNEPGIEGVLVNLYDSGGNLVATTRSDENGHYYFGGLPEGTYRVQVDTTTLPAGLANTFDADGGADSRSQVTIGNGSPLVNLNQDFGYLPAGVSGSIGNLVWLDTNADGINDGPKGPDGVSGTTDDEPGIGGVTLDLYYDANGNGMVDAGEPLMGSTVTNSSGAYLFANLPTDNGSGSIKYVVDVTDRKSVLGGYWHSLGSTGTDNNSQIDPYGVTLTPGTPDNVTADFGYYVKPAALGNYVWNDRNGNGLQDAVEPGLGGIKVSLTITYPNGTVNVLSTLTAPDGSYAFGNLLLDEDYNGIGPSGVGGEEPKFVLSVEIPAGLTTTHVDVEGNSKDLIDADNPDGVEAFTVQGQTDVSLSNTTGINASYDFGICFASIGDRVWLDKNGNKAQDAGEAGINGVTVTLYDSKNNVVATQVTSGDGFYNFIDLYADTYRVEIEPSTLPSGLVPTFDYDGIATPHKAVRVAEAGEAYDDVDFGYVGSNTLTSVCVQGKDDPTNVGAAITYVVDPSAGTVTIRTTLRRTFADTAYGTNSTSTGWPGKGRKFRQIWTSDNLELTLTNGSGTVAMRFAMDLLSPDSSAPSGYATAGIQSGSGNKDGSISVGNAGDVKMVRTSISENLNRKDQKGNLIWSDLTNSPSVKSDYSGSAIPWEWDTWYEVTVNLSAFGASGFGTPSITKLHSSPSKVGGDQPTVVLCS